MNVEEMIRKELETAISTVPTGSPAGIEAVERRGRRRQVVARVSLVLAGVVVFAGVFGVSLLVGPNAGPSLGTQPVGPGEDEVMIAGDRIPVGELVEAFASVPMYYGAAASPPTFDTSALGDEMPLDFGQVKVADPDAWDGPTIYLGEIRQQSIFMNGRSTDGVTHKCLWIGPTSQLCSDSGAFELVQTPRPKPPVAAWLTVPEETSVVVLKHGAAALGWQSPVSSVSVMTLPGDGTYQLVALDGTGTEISEIVVTFPSVTTTSAPDRNGATTTTTTVPVSEGHLLTVEAFLSFATTVDDETFAGLPLADSVMLGLGPTIIKTVKASDLGSTGTWMLEMELFRAHTGPFSALQLLDGLDAYQVSVGEHPHCASPTQPPPAGFESHERISVQPVDVDSCLDWFTVDFFVGPSGLVEAITLDVWEP